MQIPTLAWTETDSTAALDICQGGDKCCDFKTTNETCGINEGDCDLDEDCTGNQAEFFSN